MPDFKKFHKETLKFLISVAPGEPKTRVRLSKNPFPWPKSWCPLKWDKGRIWSLCAHKAFWRSEDVFGEVIDETFVHTCGTPKKFTEVGKNIPNREDKYIAIGVTDYSNARGLIFTNTEEQIYFEDHPLLRILDYDENLHLGKVLGASAAIPYIFSAVDIKNDGGACGDGGTVNYLPSAYLKEESEAVQIAVSCMDLSVPREIAYPGKGKFEWNGFFKMLENIVYASLMNNAYKDMEAYYEAGNKYYHFFAYDEIDSEMSTTSFTKLNKKTVTKAYNIGLERGRNSIREMTDTDKIQAQNFGIVIAFSGGGTLFPAMFGFGVGVAEEGYNLKHPLTGVHKPATIKAIIGGSGGALTAAYLAEFLPV